MVKMLVVCMLLVAVVFPSQAATVLTSGSTGYEYFPGFGFYKYYTQPQTWAGAVQTCIADGGHLGVISSDEEAQVFKTIIARYKRTGYFYVGLTELHDSRDFLTLDDCASSSVLIYIPRHVRGIPLAESGYSKWAPGEPNNAYGGNEKCGSINQNALLNDIRCNDNLNFICELKYPSTTRLD